MRAQRMTTHSLHTVKTPFIAVTCDHGHVSPGTDAWTMNS